MRIVGAVQRQNICSLAQTFHKFYAAMISMCQGDIFFLHSFTPKEMITMCQGDIFFLHSFTPKEKTIRCDTK